MMETLLKGFSRLFNSQVAHSKASQKAFENYYRQLLNSPLYALYDRAVHGGPGNSFNMMGPYQWECLQEWLEETHYQNVLDLGCGAGALFLLLKDKLPLKCIGIDNNEAAIQKAKKLLPSYEFFQESIEDYKVAEDCFDCLFLIDSFYHVKKPKKILRKYLSSLVKGGHLILAWSESPKGFELISFLEEEGLSYEIKDFTDEDFKVWNKAQDFLSEIVTREERENYPLLWSAKQKEVAKRIEYSEIPLRRFLIRIRKE